MKIGTKKSGLGTRKSSLGEHFKCGVPTVHPGLEVVGLRVKVAGVEWTTTFVRTTKEASVMASSTNRRKSTSPLSM